MRASLPLRGAVREGTSQGTSQGTSPGTSRGFSVVEVLVALVVVAVGLLGIAGASAMSLRAANSALRERAAVHGALARLSTLAASGCAGASSGSASSPLGWSERWSASSPARGVAMIESRIDWQEGRTSRWVLLRSAMLC